MCIRVALIETVKGQQGYKYYRCATEAPLTIHRACALGANDLPQLFKRNKLHQLISSLAH
jgi:hypothetical protein